MCLQPNYLPLEINKVSEERREGGRKGEEGGGRGLSGDSGGRQLLTARLQGEEVGDG